MQTTEDFIHSARRTISVELQAVEKLLQRIDASFAKACELLLNCEGRTVILGTGKSGHVGRKIAATLASTGTPAFFVHAGEASHGDMGMITGRDVVIAISYSGTTSEIVTLLPLIKRLGAPLISMTGKPSSALSQAADVNLDVGVDKEACPLDLAPTASTTVTLAMGDALAIALLEAKGFTEEDFAFSHPGGALGRRLLLKVRDIMHSGERMPLVSSDTLLSKALLEITRKSLGMTGVVDDNGLLMGIYTDGDLRRTLDQGIDPHTTPIADVMTRDCITIRADILAAEALKIMEDNKINALICVTEDGKPEGALNTHDLLRAGVV
ncbi:KpsF/GutQ family sugar-phosphate isomerase [Endozoicomonadaceae bacterium StTr2]